VKNLRLVKFVKHIHTRTHTHVSNYSISSFNISISNRTKFIVRSY